MAYFELVHLKHIVEEQVICFVRSVLEAEKASVSRREDLANTVDDSAEVIRELFQLPAKLKDVRIWEGRDRSHLTLAEKIFNLPAVAENFELHALVSSVIRTDKVLADIRSQFVSNRCILQEGKISYLLPVIPSIEDEGELLHKSLKGKKYLILHGLQNFDIWDAIQSYFPDDNVGSRVLLSRVLNPKESWKLSMEREDIVAGLDEEMSKIIDELTRPPSKLSMVTITGMGGIGKTTLAKNVYNHPSVSLYFHCIAWINNVSDIDQVLSHLLHHFSSACGEEIQGKTIQDSGEILRKSLKGRKYLIVVDDLWKFDVWNDVQSFLPDDKMGSRVLITTRITEFSSCSNIHKNPSHSMSLMDKDESWELLEKLVFGNKSCPDELVKVGKQIAKACGGLPLAVVVIAGFLCSTRSSSLNVWGSVKSYIVQTISADGCMDILSFSYKSCFLSMGAFPANAEIGVEYLLRLWIASGILEPKYYNDLEIEAEECMTMLIDRNLISIGKRGLDGKIKTCFIHPLVRQLCLEEAQKKNFMQVLEPGTNNAQVHKNKRHLISNLDNLDDFQSLVLHPHLCSELALGKALLQMLVSCKGLRVLHVYFLPFETFPLRLLNLVNLRFLAIHVSYELDARISQLLKLETLVVYGPWIPRPALFLELWKMRSLRHVEIRVPCCLEYPYLLSSVLDVPQAPSKLQCISVITFSSCTRELLLLMPKLKKLGVSETKEDFENGQFIKCFQNLSFLNQLQALNCSFYKGNREMRHLDFDALPVSLKKLTLDGGGLSWDKIKFLALLPELETLKLKNYAFRGPEWVVDEELVFGCLKQMMIENTDLVNWEVESTRIFRAWNA